VATLNMIPVQRPQLGEEELKAVAAVFSSRWLGLGATTKEFEDRLKKYLGVKHVIAVNTGTSALHIALEVLGLQPGDEVIVPSLTFVASVQAILMAGAKPVFCDICPETLNLDLASAEKVVTPRVRAIMPVHYGGLACDMDPIQAFAKARDMRVVEDAAHAFGSSYHGRKIGTLGDLTCFSFDPIKNITCGEGGAVTTNDDTFAETIIRKRILGINNDTWARYRNERNWYYEVVTPGYRYHLPNLNAAIGLAQLDKMGAFQERKKAIVAQYDSAFKDISGLRLLRRNLEETFPFFYIVRVLNKKRDELAAHLKSLGIGTGVHYIPNHMQPLFADRRKALPVTEQIFDEIITLPLYFEMTDSEVGQVIDGVQKFFNQKTGV
jgi:dTDP-4-amino-4,6-dideoxygalactose transaminase